MDALLLSNFLRFVLVGLWLLILARVVFSFIDPMGRGRIAAFVIQTSEPLLAPVRKALPRTRRARPVADDLLIVLGVLMRAVV
ncbi:MAG: YggT family protein [Chloroflexota bacterium]